MGVYPLTNGSAVFSVVFCAACAVSAFLGMYAISLNARSGSNRLFFALSLALDIWALGFTLAISASDLSICLFWRRFSAIGWGTFFCLLLHFILALTEQRAVLKKWWIYVPLYFPALVNLLGFTYFPQLNPEQYNLVQTSLGWINIAVNNAWDWFFTASYILYSAVGVCLLWRWGKKSTDRNIRRQAYNITYSILITFILGSVIDVFFNSLFSVKLPQMAPFLMLLPMAVSFYTIRKFGFLNPKPADDDSQLMSDQIRTKIVNYLANAFLAAALINILALYLFFENARLEPVLLFSGVFVLIGILFQAIQRSCAGRKIKDILFAVLISLLVPALTLRFIEFGSVTIWAFPFVLLIITLVFESRIIQFALIVSIFLTQLLVWLLKPEVTMTVDAADHIVRIGMFGIAVWFSLFVKKVFVSKLGENAVQINSQNIITQISTDFVSVSENNFTEKTDKALGKLGLFFNADRAYIYLFGANSEKLTRRYLWLNKRVLGQSPELPETIEAARCPRFIEALSANRLTDLTDTDVMMPEAAPEPGCPASSQIESVKIVPVTKGGALLGFLGIESNRNKWREAELNTYQIMANIFSDALSKVEQEREINFLAYHDGLTTLPNRFLFKSMVNQAIALAAEAEKRLAVMFLGPDAFKNVNDMLGHDGGDELLVRVSELLLGAVREHDTVARFGGDEFLILLSNIDDPDEILSIADKIIGIFRSPFKIGEQEFFMTASAGIAVYPSDGGDADTLLKHADIAMSKAKEKGKNQYMLCSADLKENIALKAKLTNALYRTLERNELILYYQPQVSVETRKIVGVEALIRWRHPEMGMISPGVFIPLAESTGLINPIGEWVLDTACRQCKAWQDAGLPPVRMAVNVSIHQFRNPRLIPIVGRVLAESGLDPKYLELEITESAAFSATDDFAGVFDALKNLGVSISIDDFGTEYSSLSRLNMMPIDRLKMDMQFIKNIGRSERDKAVARSIINLAQNLGISVIAEGVEEETQLDFLLQNRCDEVQGYYFYRPCAAQDVELALKSDENGSCDNG
jgi:diguanylate cyclase (GGDEF)-like protein